MTDSNEPVPAILAPPEFHFPKPSLWTKFLLLFRPSFISVDHGIKNGDKTVKLRCKSLHGKIYVVGEEVL